MTLREVIEEIDAIEPNAYSDEQKARWVLRTEGHMETNVFLMPARHFSFLPDYNRRLLVPSPFDGLYVQYLHAMIHYANSEYERYQNDMSLYNETSGGFARWFAAAYEPALTGFHDDLRWEITLGPGESYAGAFPDAEAAGIVSPLSVRKGDGISGTIELMADGDRLLDWCDGELVGGMAHNALDGCRITGKASLVNASDETQSITASGLLYRYGWDNYRERFRCPER